MAGFEFINFGEEGKQRAELFGCGDGRFVGFGIYRPTLAELCEIAKAHFPDVDFKDLRCWGSEDDGLYFGIQSSLEALIGA